MSKAVILQRGWRLFGLPVRKGGSTVGAGGERPRPTSAGPAAEPPRRSRSVDVGQGRRGRTPAPWPGVRTLGADDGCCMRVGLLDLGRVAARGVLLAAGLYLAGRLAGAYEHQPSGRRETVGDVFWHTVDNLGDAASLLLPLGGGVVILLTGFRLLAMRYGAAEDAGGSGPGPGGDPLAR